MHFCQYVCFNHDKAVIAFSKREQDEYRVLQKKEKSHLTKAEAFRCTKELLLHIFRRILRIFLF